MVAVSGVSRVVPQVCLPRSGRVPPVSTVGAASHVGVQAVAFVIESRVNGANDNSVSATSVHKFTQPYTFALSEPFWKLRR